MALSLLRGGQDGEAEKQKSYLARCRLPCPVTARHLEQLNATRDLLLQQRTPTRVEHRRAMLVRSPIYPSAHGVNDWTALLVEGGGCLQIVGVSLRAVLCEDEVQQRACHRCGRGWCTACRRR